MELRGKKINFLGDSITEGLRASGPSARFSHQIAEMCGAECRNYGISGTRIAIQRVPSADPNIDRYFASRVEEMDADADIIVVLGGSNDYLHGDAPMGSMQDRAADTFYGGLHVLYTRLIERYPGRLIVVMTPPHAIDEERVRAGHTLLDYVRVIRQVAEYYALPVLDLYASSGIQPAVPILREMYMPDGRHPSDAGHVLLARKIIRFLESC